MVEGRRQLWEEERVWGDFGEKPLTSVAPQDQAVEAREEPVGPQATGQAWGRGAARGWQTPLTPTQERPEAEASGCAQSLCGGTRDSDDRRRRGPGWGGRQGREDWTRAIDATSGPSTMSPCEGPQGCRGLKGSAARSGVSGRAPENENQRPHGQLGDLGPVTSLPCHWRRFC